MKKLIKILSVFTLLGLSSGCDLAEQIEKKAAMVNQYENIALTLAKENRGLKVEINRLQFQIQQLKSKNNYQKIQLDEKAGDLASGKSHSTTRVPASVAPAPSGNDLVKFDVYKWTPSQVITMAEKEFSENNFEKSAQFFQTFSTNFPTHKRINDQFLFQAGVASFESGKHHDWTLMHLEKLVKNYPTSKFYRGAKLWIGLTYLKQGEQDKFFMTVEEFRKKYRNTNEWKILSSHYEKIVQKYKKN